MDAHASEARIGAAPDATDRHVRAAHLLAVRAGQPIFEIGDPADAFLVVQCGEVVLLEPGPGGTPRLVAQLGPGDPVGETDALLGRPRSVRAVAASDARLLQLDRSTFRAMCLERPEIALRIVVRLAERSAELERRLAALGMNDLVRPVARALVRRLPERRDQAVRLALTLRELAEAAGLSMREAHRGLSELFERKWVRLVDDALVVADPAALAASLVEDAEATGTGNSR